MTAVRVASGIRDAATRFAANSGSAFSRFMRSARSWRPMAWSSLMRQTGCDYKGKDAVKDFKHNAKVTLKKVRKVYPLLKLSDVAGGFYVHPSPPAIPRRAMRRNLPAEPKQWIGM